MSRVEAHRKAAHSLGSSASSGPLERQVPIGIAAILRRRFIEHASQREAAMIRVRFRTFPR